jgi:hypothetical protein
MTADNHSGKQTHVSAPIRPPIAVKWSPCRRVSGPSVTPGYRPVGRSILHNRPSVGKRTRPRGERPEHAPTRNRVGCVFIRTRHRIDCRQPTNTAQIERSRDRAVRVALHRWKVDSRHVVDAGERYTHTAVMTINSLPAPNDIKSFLDCLSRR